LKRLILVLGGARSGKSDLAEKLARDAGGPVLYLATAEAGDDEMRARIEEHRRRRPPDWRTVEAPTRITDAVEEHGAGAAVVLLDSVTLWASNLLLQAPDPAAAEDDLMAQIGVLHDWYRGGTASLVIVSDEVGMGLVPDYPAGRAFRDLLGHANQRLAQIATEVYLSVAGIPIELKALAARPWKQDEP
jgi:adenosylcobinamide kinase/adenosylcobinamide-phosphate guanylyltransferase